MTVSNIQIVVVVWVELLTRDHGSRRDRWQRGHFALPLALDMGVSDFILASCSAVAVVVIVTMVSVVMRAVVTAGMYMSVRVIMVTLVPCCWPSINFLSVAMATDLPLTRGLRKIKLESLGRRAKRMSSEHVWREGRRMVMVCARARRGQEVRREYESPARVRSAPRPSAVVYVC